MRKARSLQERLPDQAEIQGRAPPSSKHLLLDKKPMVEVMATVEEVKEDTEK